jgi:hypothetical protein
MMMISASSRLYPTLVEERPARFCDFSKLSTKITAKEKEQKIQQVSEGQKKKSNKTCTRWANARTVKTGKEGR